MSLSAWHTQLRKGAAELVVLSIVERGRCYGLQILQESTRAGDLVSEGGLYQLLNRLERDRKLASNWSLDGDSSHPRKYYELTAEGGRTLAEMRSAWVDFRKSVSAIVED